MDLKRAKAYAFLENSSDDFCFIEIEAFGKSIICFLVPLKNFR
jgi:hypothetical protein